MKRGHLSRDQLVAEKIREHHWEAAELYLYIRGLNVEEKQKYRIALNRLLYQMDQKSEKSGQLSEILELKTVGYLIFTFFSGVVTGCVTGWLWG